MRASKLIAMAVAVGVMAGPAVALAQTGSSGNSQGGGNGGNLPPGIPTTGSQGTPNALPPSYGVSRSVPTGAAPSSNRYAGQGPQVKTFNGQPMAGSSTTPGPNTATQ